IEALPLARSASICSSSRALKRRGSSALTTTASSSRPVASTRPCWSSIVSVTAISVPWATPRYAVRSASASSSRTCPVSRTIGPTRAIAENVCGERSMPSACPVAGASKITSSPPRRAEREPPDLDHRHDLARARRGGGEILEGAAGGEDAPRYAAAQRLHPLEQRAVRIDRERRQPLLEPDRLARLACAVREHAGHARVTADLDDRRSSPRARRELPQSGGDGRLADPALPGHDDQPAVEKRLHPRAVSQARPRAPAARRRLQSSACPPPPSRSRSWSPT